MDTGNPVDLRNTRSRFVNNAPPPVKTIPLSTMSAANSGSRKELPYEFKWHELAQNNSQLAAFSDLKAVFQFGMVILRPPFPLSFPMPTCVTFSSNNAAARCKTPSCPSPHSFARSFRDGIARLPPSEERFTGDVLRQVLNRFRNFMIAHYTSKIKRMRKTFIAFHESLAFCPFSGKRNCAFRMDFVTFR